MWLGGVFFAWVRASIRRVKKKFTNTDHAKCHNMAPHSRPLMELVMAPLKFVGAVLRNTSLLDGAGAREGET